MKLAALIPVGLVAWLLGRERPAVPSAPVGNPLSPRVPTVTPDRIDQATRPAGPRRSPLTWREAQRLPKGHPERELDYLARTVWGEAEGESTLGKIGVAHVVLKRVRSSRYGWPDTIEEVVTQRYQFECWDRPDRTPKMIAATSSTPAFMASWEAARGALMGEAANPVPGADHFVTTRLAAVSPPSWLTAAIWTRPLGRHLFARLT